MGERVHGLLHRAAHAGAASPGKKPLIHTSRAPCSSGITGDATKLATFTTEIGEVSSQDVLNRFVTGLGGTLKLIADFGDEQLRIA
jgi:hypothetical protein